MMGNTLARQTSDGRRTFATWWAAIAIAFTLVAAGCGGDDDSTSTAAPEAEGGAADGSDATDDVSSDAESEPAPATDDEPAEEPVVAAGTGTLVVDLCRGGQFIDGAITIDDLVTWGVFGSSDVEIDGGPGFDALGYNDFGALCNIDAVGGGDSITVSMNNQVGAYDGAAERSPDAVGSAGGWKWVLSGGLETLVMEHTGADGTRDTFGILWFPDDDDRKTLEEVRRVFDPLVAAIVERTTVDIERIEAPATPDWWACGDTDAGVAGLDPTALLATLGAPEGRGARVSASSQGSFGFTECTAETEVGLDSVTVKVQDPTAELQDTVESFLAGWPDAVAETIAGYEVAVLDARAFTVVDGTPMEISILVTDPDIDSDFRAVIELVLSSIG